MPDADESPALSEFDREMAAALASLAEEAAEASKVPPLARPRLRNRSGPPRRLAASAAPSPSKVATRVESVAQDETPILLEDVEVLPALDENAAAALQAAQQEAASLRSELSGAGGVGAPSRTPNGPGRTGSGPGGGGTRRAEIRRRWASWPCASRGRRPAANWRRPVRSRSAPRNALPSRMASSPRSGRGCRRRRCRPPPAAPNWWRPRGAPRTWSGRSRSPGRRPRDCAPRWSRCDPRRTACGARPPGCATKWRPWRRPPTGSATRPASSRRGGRNAGPGRWVPDGGRVAPRRGRWVPCGGRVAPRRDLPRPAVAPRSRRLRSEAEGHAIRPGPRPSVPRPRRGRPACP